MQTHHRECPIHAAPSLLHTCFILKSGEGREQGQLAKASSRDVTVEASITAQASSSRTCHRHHHILRHFRPAPTRTLSVGGMGCCDSVRRCDGHTQTQGHRHGTWMAFVPCFLRSTPQGIQATEHTDCPLSMHAGELRLAANLQPRQKAVGERVVKPFRPAHTAHMRAGSTSAHTCAQTGDTEVCAEKDTEGPVPHGRTHGHRPTGSCHPVR
jgi:hypothetical protein